MNTNPKRLFYGIATLVVIATAALAWSRVGLLNLPSVPAGLTIDRAGLADLSALRELDDYIRSSNSSAEPPPSLAATASAAAKLVRAGFLDIQRGEVEIGLEQMRQGLRQAPDNLVLANAYRMTAFQQRREFLRSAKQTASLVPEFPPHLDGQPIRFLKELDRARPSRETKLHLAMAWVDHMLLFPALEIKAPSSVEAVNLLTQVIDRDNPAYVPALFARGMNHLHRPSRLVWPETERTPKDAAAQDIARCIAIGKKLGAGSPRLQASLAVALGDAYVKADKNDLARSWWQIAQNLAAGDADLQSAIRRRYGWRNEEILDRLEDELDRARTALDRPMTDLAFMWN